MTDVDDDDDDGDDDVYAEFIDQTNIEHPK
jgi:hypothetical protein